MTNTVDRLITHYHQMFSFPGTVMLIAENFAAALIVAALISFLTPTNSHNFITLSIIIILSQLLSSEITYQVTPDRRLLDRRRSLGLTFASSTLMFPAFIIALTLIPIRATANIPLAIIVISASLETYIRYFATFMYMQIARLRLLATTLSQPAILLLGASLLYPQALGKPTQTIGGIVLAIVLAELSIQLIKQRLSGLLKLDALKLSRSFFAGWMGHEPERLETILESKSVLSDLEIESLVVKGAGEGQMKAVFIAPRIHAGPFRNLGSSNLPAVLSEKIEAGFSVLSFVFHGAVSHERDLVHSSDTSRIAEALIERLRQPYEDFHHGCMIVRTPGLMVGGLGFNHHLLLWISLAPLLSEDLPYQLQLSTEAYASRQGVGRVSIIDTHSCLSPTQPAEEDMRTLEEQIHAAVDNLTIKELSKLELGVARVDVKGFSTEEIAGLKGVAAFLKAGSESQGILLFDSNNMTQELRQLLDDELPKALGAPIDVFTTDTHILVGIRAKKDYSPLGEKTERQLVLERSLDALRRAKSDMEPVTISPATVTVRDVPILGENTIETLGKAANVMINLARILLTVAIIACGLLTLSLFLI